MVPRPEDDAAASTGVERRLFVANDKVSIVEGKGGQGLHADNTRRLSAEKIIFTHCHLIESYQRVA